MKTLTIEEEIAEMENILTGIGKCINKGYTPNVSLAYKEKKIIPVKGRIAFHLKKLRISKGLTQREIAEALHIPVATYGNHENARYEPSSRFLRAYARFFDVSVEDLKEDIYET